MQASLVKFLEIVKRKADTTPVQDKQLETVYAKLRALHVSEHTMGDVAKAIGETLRLARETAHV